MSCADPSMKNLIARLAMSLRTTPNGELAFGMKLHAERSPPLEVPAGIVPKNLSNLFF